MDAHFKWLMRWWGKRYGEYRLIKGDFLEEIHKEKVLSANVIFVNNFAFGPTLDHQLKGLLLFFLLQHIFVPLIFINLFFF